MASQELSGVKAALRQQGLLVVEGINDQFDFYRVVSQELYGSDKHPKSARKEILEYQNEKEFNYFQLFLNTGLPETSYKDKTLKKILEEHVKVKPRCPSARELYACAEKLRVNIYVYSKLDEQSKWTWFRFAPVLSDDDKASNQYLMFLRYRIGSCNYVFAKIEEINKENGTDLSSEQRLPDVLKNHNFQHPMCFTFRFTIENIWSRDFQDVSIQHCEYIKEERDRDTDNWDREFLEHDHSLFRCISKELYDTDDYFQLVCEAVCALQLQDDYIGVFAQFIDASDQQSTEKLQKRLLQEHIKQVRQGKKIGKGEIFAVASLLHVPIYVYTVSSKWEIYPPLTTCTKESASYVTLLEFAVNRYERLIPRNKHCNCEIVPPKITGNMKKLGQDISGFILETVGKNKSCCPGSRHGRHAHLDGIARGMNMSYFVMSKVERYTYIYPGESTANVIRILEEEGRTLNLIADGGGTLYECLSKEIFGREKGSQVVEDQMNSKCVDTSSTEADGRAMTDVSLEVISDASNKLLQLHGTELERASVWLGVPIYIFTETGDIGSRRFKWKRVMTSEDHPKCRYYVTLYYNSGDNLFSPIVPIQGCNCQLLPPISIFQGQCQETENVDITTDLHEPMIEFLLDRLPENESYERQERNIPASHIYTDTHIVMKRADMADRVIDQVGLDSHSFYRCISKEIFGTENHFIFIRQLVAVEMREHLDMYGEFLCNNSAEKTISNAKKKQNLEKHIQEVEHDAEADCFEILATATIFQVPIYILSLEVSGTTRWIEYTQLRRKPKPATLPKRISKCRQLKTSEKFFVTLLLSSSGHYDRIVPASVVCNCLSTKPTPPGAEQFSYPEMSENENHSLMLMREVESSLCKLKIALNNWLMTNITMQKLCETIINQLEGNRRNVNIATITGTATGMVGAILAISGLIAGPVTFGASLGLTIAGGIIGGVGGVTSMGAKLTEAVLVKMTLAQMNFTRTMLSKRSDALKEAVTDLHEKIQNLDDSSKSLIQSGTNDIFDKALLQSFAGIARTAKEVFVIPLAMLRFSIRGATIAGAIFGPLTIAIDIGFMAYSIWNLCNGSKTDTSENLRKTSSILKASESQMKVWANGNN